MDKNILKSFYLGSFQPESFNHISDKEP